MNKQAVIDFILKSTGDSFLTIDDNRKIFALDEYFIPVFEYGKTEINDNEFNQIFPFLKEYIRLNPNQFVLGDLVHENANWNSGEKDVNQDWVSDNDPNVTPIDMAVASRSWWSPIATENARRMADGGKCRVKLPNGKLVKVFLTNSRKIEHPTTRSFLHPGGFTENQFEELRKLIPNTCRVEKCHNNLNFGPGYPGGWDGGGEGHWVVGGICNFHHKYNDYKYDIMKELGGSTTTPTGTTPPNNTGINNEVAAHNLLISELIRICEENGRVVERGRGKGLNLVDLSDEVNRFELALYWDLPLTHLNNQEARTIEKFIKDTFQKNKKSLEQLEGNNNGNPSPNDNNQEISIGKSRDNAITEINQEMLKEPKISEHELEKNNLGWENLIKSSSNLEQINSLREKLLADIRGKRQEKVFANKLSELVQKGQGTEDYEKLKKIVEQIETFRGQKNYSSLEKEISKLKKKLAEKNPEKYRIDNVKMIEEEMKKKGVRREELDSDVKKELERLESGEITKVAEIDAAKNKISNNIVKKSVENKLASYLKEYQKAPDETAKKIAKKKLLDFISNKNHFYESAYQNRKREVDKILGIISTQPNSSKNNFPLVPVMIIGSFFAFLICLVIIIRKRRILKRKNKL